MKINLFFKPKNQFRKFQPISAQKNNLMIKPILYTLTNFLKAGTERGFKWGIGAYSVQKQINFANFPSMAHMPSIKECTGHQVRSGIRQDFRKMSGPVSGRTFYGSGRTKISANDRISQMTVTFEPSFLDNGQQFPA